GIAARFYRLAFRINMEQLKLCERDELPPLAEDEMEEQALAAGASSEEIRAALQKTIADFDAAVAKDRDLTAETERLQQIEAAERLALAEEVLRGQESGDRGQET